MRTRIRYYSEDDPDIGVVPSQLKRLGRAKQIQYLVSWFHSNFEDPANETPYVSAEGGYQYIWGGPYDANDELQNEFSGIVPYERIEEAVNEIQADGTFEWAPGPNHPDKRQREEEAFLDSEQESKKLELSDFIAFLDKKHPTHFGEEEERLHRKDILSRIESIEIELERIRPAHGGIGHNNPPPEVDAPSQFDRQEMVHLLDGIKEQLNQQKPNALQVAKDASKLEGMVKWFGEKANKATDKFAETIGAGAGLIVLNNFCPSVGALVKDLIGAIIKWLHTITFPF